jgi:hypothetical protein
MRKNGTKYKKIDTLPKNALPVSKFAEKLGIAVGQVYIKYERFINGKGKDPKYSIRCFMGSNFIISN